MFALNFKKDWKMHKSLLISFFIIALIVFTVITGIYFVIKYSNINERTYKTLNDIWMLVSTLVMLLSSILPIVLMVKVLTNDLGKKNVHYTIFTPQSLTSWYLPKILYVVIIQGLFALINLGYTYLIMDATKMMSEFQLKEQLTTVFVSTFSIGLFALNTLIVALFYSFRKKAVSWTLIVVSIFIYVIAQLAYAITKSIQQNNAGSTGKIDIVKTAFIQYGVDSLLGILMIATALYLIHKKIEY